jgi:hypothetical protein
MPEVPGYDQAYYSMVWMGPKGYPENANAGRCYFTGLLGMYRLNGEADVLFADGTSGDGFSFRWWPQWGVPAFNGGAGAFHEIWEYTSRSLGFDLRWEEDAEGGWDEAWGKLRALIDQGIPVQVGLHYSLLLPYGAASSPRLAFLHGIMPPTGFGHHVVIAGYDLERGTVTVFEPNDVLPHSRYEAPILVLRRAWEEASQRDNDGFQPWAGHKPWDGEWTLHDGYGPYQMLWLEQGRDPAWNIAQSIRHSYRRNLKILAGEYPKPYAVFVSQWQIPKYLSGAPGMAQCAEAARRGELKDALHPNGSRQALFSQANIPNHGVLGRAAAAGYLSRVARELDARGLRSDAVSLAADCMRASSDLFRTLRYENDLAAAGEILGRIAEKELAALRHMQSGWSEVREITTAAVVRNSTPAAQAA